MYAGSYADNQTPEVTITVPRQLWDAHAMRMLALEQQNGRLKSDMKQGEALLVTARSFTSNLGAVSRLMVTLEYLESHLYSFTPSGHVHYHEAFQNRKDRWRWILVNSSDAHAKIISDSLQQTAQKYVGQTNHAELVEAFCTLVSVICSAFSNLRYPSSLIHNQMYNAEFVMSSLTSIGIIRAEDYWWVNGIIYAITHFPCFTTPLPEDGSSGPAQPAQVSTSASSSFASSSPTHTS